MKPGPKVGEILNQLLEFVLEDEIRNQKDLLLQKAQDLLKEEVRRDKVTGECLRMKKNVRES